MSTLSSTYLKNASSISNNIELDTSGNIALQAGTAAAPALQATGDTNTGLLFPATDTVAVSTGGSERARIDSSGRLLVGTTTSVSQAGIQGLIQVEATSTNEASIKVKGNSNDVFPASIALSKSRGTSVGSNTAVQNGDGVGSIFFFAADGTDTASWCAEIAAFIDGTPGSNDVPGRLVFSTTADGASTPTERVRIDNAGTTKFTAAAASTNLVQAVNDNATPTGIAIEANFGSGTGTNTNTAYLYSGRSGGAQRFYVYGNGGIANYSANNSNLSDRNAKKDITPAAGTWDCIKEWEIVNYRYKDQADDADLNLGVIAQQVAESCPEVITVFEQATEDRPEKLGIKEQQMYWMAIKALQEAQVRIETLEAKVAALESV